MKEVNIDSFTDVDDALLWLENEIVSLDYEGCEDIKGEIALINGVWRVSVITDSRQMEFNL